MATLKHNATTVAYQFHVTDVELVEALYISAFLVPSTVTVTFVDGTFSTLEVKGHRAKKDGTAGQNPLDTTFYPYNVARLPDWAAPLTDFAHATKLAEG